MLRELGAAAYIAEPGPNALFFANVSLRDWGTSERPFLLIVTPHDAQSVTNGTQTHAHVSVLAPAFEETRARLLTIPAPGDGARFATWPEEGDPYAVALREVSDASGLKGGVVFVDESVRFFIADRLRAAAGARFDVRIAPPEVRALRERKSVAELALMTCANEVWDADDAACRPSLTAKQVTLLAIREVRHALYIGIKASEATKLLHQALADAGLKSTWGLAMFGGEGCFAARVRRTC